jgi:hypothetical protein
MANWSNPLLTSTYTNFLTEVKDRDTDLALQFDGTTSSNIPTNAIRWNSSVNRWQKWNGSSWGELTSTYALTGLSTTGGATIGGTLGSGAITSTGSVTGTALIPSGSSAPTNGLYLAGTNTIGLATNSAGRVFIDAAGEVGIGTGTPETCLDIGLGAPSATIGNVRISSSGQARFHLYNGGATAEWLFGQKTISSHNFILSKSVGGSESDYLVVDTAGRVGIGTLSPASGLHVLEDGNAQINISATNAGSNSAGISFENQGQRNWQIWADRATDQIRIGNNSRGSTNLAIKNDGSVGINTTAPLATFDTHGSARFGAANAQTVPASSGAGGCHFSWNYVSGSAETDIYNLYDNAPKSFLFRQKTGASTASDVLQIGTSGHIFYVGGTEKITIDSSGRLGIGASNPTYSLDVVSADTTAGVGYAARLRANATAGAAALQFTDNGATAQYGYIACDSSSNLKFTTGVTERLRLNGSGDLGLGTTSPYSRFTVVPSSTPSTPATANQITVGEATGNSAYRLQLGYLYDTLGRGSIQAYDNGNPSPLILNGAGGNVGIGTTSPVSRLHVNGSATVSSQANVAAKIGSAATSDLLLGSLNGNSPFVASEGAYPLLFFTNANECLRITSAGRFGLGTTTPEGSFDVALAAPSATIGNIRISPSSPGQARYHLYNGGATAEWLFGQANSTSHDFTFSKSVGGSESEYLRIGTSGQIGIGGANYGTSGQVLTSNGSGASPSWTTVTALTAGTAVSATGTAVDFTGIPSSAKRITVMIDAVSTDATATLAIQLGDSGGIETSGYTGGLAWTGPSTGSSGSASTFPLAIGAASDTVSGHAVITKVSGNTWVLSSTVARDNDYLVFISGGSKGLSATLDRIRITTTGGTASFDGGTVNILYE